MAHDDSPARPRFEGRLPKWPAHDVREEDAVLRVVRSGRWWREAGDEVDSFEQEFAKYLGAAHARAVTNGTQAIELALACLGIKPGDEVIVPACTFISTASAVLGNGASPIPVDVVPDTLCLDVAAVEEAVTERTRAILPVHMAGHVCDMDALSKLAERRGLDIIEDAAHSHGARYKGQSAGTLGRVSIFSFQSGKLMTAGEGGALVTSDQAVAAQTFERHACGRPRGDREYVHRFIASNLRMSEIQAAILRVQLQRLPEHLTVREARAAYLDRLLGRIPGVKPLARRPEATVHSHYMYMVWLDPEAFGGRKTSAIARELRQQGLPAFRCFPPVHLTEMFSPASLRSRGLPFSPTPLPEYASIRTPISEAAGQRVLWLHHSVLLAEEPLLEEIADCVAELQRAPR